MAKPLVSDELWAAVAPLVPSPPLKAKPGRPRVPDRAALTGIIFVLKTGVPWEDLPQEMGGGSGMTCWRRLRDWQQAGVWHRLHRVLLDRLGTADRIDWSRASADSATVPAKGLKKGRRTPSTSARTRRTGPNQGRNTIWWQIVTASRSPSDRPPRT
jgi:transposase